MTPPQPGAYVNFGTDPLPAGVLTTYPPGCIPDTTSADPTDYVCSGPTGEGQATIQASCTLPPAPSPAGCAPGYTQNGNICEYTGGPSGNRCLPGITLTHVAATVATDVQCCQSIPGGTDSYTLCPVNAPYLVDGVCMPWPLQTMVSASASVGLGSCETGNPGGV